MTQSREKSHLIYLLDEATQTLVLAFVAGDMTFTLVNVVKHVRQLVEQSISGNVASFIIKPLPG